MISIQVGRKRGKKKVGDGNRIGLGAGLQAKS